MTIAKGIKTVIFILLIMACSFSFISYAYFTNKLNIKKVIFKKGIFELSNKAYEFNLDGLTSDDYNVALKFYHDKDIDFSELAENKIQYTINTELRDVENNLLKSDVINQNSRIHEGGSQEYLVWYFLPFSAERWKKYKLKMEFQSDNKFFDKMAKEIYIEEIYDFASAPWWALFQRISLTVFIITLLPLLLISLIYWLKKKKRKQA